MCVDRGEADTTIVHLASKDLITKEVVPKYATVTIRTKYALMPSDIWEVTDHGMQRVVLLFHII